MSTWETATREQLRAYREETGTDELSLGEFKEFAFDRLQALFPENNSVDASIRATLQKLRNQGELTFLGDGDYRILSLEGDVQTDSRRMTTDRFFGSAQEWLHGLRSMLEYIEAESPTQPELTAWIQETTDSQSPETIKTNLSFQRTLRFFEERNGTYHLTDRGHEFAASGDRNIIAKALFENVKGFEAILQTLERPRSGETIQKALQAAYPDYKLPWDVVHQHIEWLQAIEAIEQEDGTYTLTSYGETLREKVQSQQGQDQGQLSDYTQTVNETPRVWIEKTSVEKNKYKKEGELRLGNAIYSPSQDRGGNDIYGTMREAAVGDFVLHLNQDVDQLVGISQIESELETDFEGRPEFDWTEEQAGYRRWLSNYTEFEDPIDIKVEVLNNDAFEQTLEEIRASYNNLFFNKNGGYVQGGYFTQCPPELLELFVSISEELTASLEAQGYPIEVLPSRGLEPSSGYDSVSEATSDVLDRLDRTPGESNWLTDQLGKTIIRDWTDSLRGFEPGSVVSIERGTKLKQIAQLYKDSEERFEAQAQRLHSGGLNQLSPAATLFVVFLRDLQKQAGKQPNANQVKISLILDEAYEVRKAEPDVREDEEVDEPAKGTLENGDHPLVRHLETNDVSIYTFTAPPDYWLTVFEYAALGFRQHHEGQWSNLEAGDVVLFHSQSSPMWNDLLSQNSGLVGAGIVRAKTTKRDGEAWWYNEHVGSSNAGFPFLVAFERLFGTGNLESIDFTKQTIEKDLPTVSTELAHLIANLLSDESHDRIPLEVPRFGLLESGRDDPEHSDRFGLTDTLASYLKVVPPIALQKSFTGTLPASLLDGLYFPDGTGEEIIAQIQVALRTGKHLILTGPPGTGKTEIAQRVCEYLEAEYPYLYSGSQVTTATADWSTFDTVGGYMPNGESTNGTQLEFSPGLILNRFKHRRDLTQLNEPLVIDELNRADIDKAFGQLFTVLSGQSVQLPYTRDEAEITLTPADATTNLPAAHEYVIPPSWPLFATLNTYDKTSLYEMSYAFMRRFAFIRVPAPSLPEDRAELRQIMRSYADAWGISVDDATLVQVGAVWRATNSAVEDRSIGPAVVKDILSSVTSHTTVSQSKRLTQAVISFICPQLEGVPKREKILRRISDVDRIDVELLDQAARDMLQVALITDE